jgi:hypothetical protein
MPRFTVGESVGLKGLLAEIHGGATGRVVSIVPNKDCITSLDEYEIAFDDSRHLRIRDFQLTHVKLTNEMKSFV